jgi:ATP-dependent exoDNAse (exonuclease V) beta subunit
VAATRARKRLHLLGHARTGTSGEPVPRAGSLLHACRSAFALQTLAVPAKATAGSAIPPRGFPLRRLPADWRLPTFAASLELAETAHRRPSDAAYRREEERRTFSLRAEDGRIIGTVVHGWLERLAQDGLRHWSAERLAGCRPQLEAELVQAGIPRSRVTACVERCFAALDATLRSSRGRWILGEQREAGCELALSGVVDGTPVSAVIDRTFIDEQGVRWIVDYKCSGPAQGETAEAFLAGQVELYRAQLDLYGRLLALTEVVPQKKALYFPLMDCWSELSE